jgi:hypothetical protein
MGFFDDIFKGIFGGPAKADEAPAAGTTAPPTGAPAAPTAPSTPASPASPAAPAAPVAVVDVAAILDAKVKASGQKLDWRKSIVDLMKALGIDSSFSARKALAAELGYTGSTSDSAAMNIWLHKQVIQKLKDNGGKVPADLLD